MDHSSLKQKKQIRSNQALISGVLKGKYLALILEVISYLGSDVSMPPNWPPIMSAGNESRFCRPEWAPGSHKSMRSEALGRIMMAFGGALSSTACWWRFDDMVVFSLTSRVCLTSQNLLICLQRALCASLPCYSFSSILFHSALLKPDLMATIG